MNPAEFAARVERRLRGPLPRDSVRARFAPRLAFGRHFGPPAPDSRPAAVIALIYPHEGAWRLPLTVRPASMPAHAGQVSLPGGLVEAGEDSRAAALRELNEELGVAAGRVRILGRLSPLFLFVTNFNVTPWVAVANRRPDFLPSPDEVAEVIEAPLRELADATRHGVRLQAHGPLEFRAPYMAVGGHEVWGATSMILAELLEVLELD